MNDEAVVDVDGVQIRKSFDADDFPVPAVTFDVTSEREDDVTVRIVDDIPEEFGIDQIGFHPDYGSDFWSATGDGEVHFERTVQAGESFTTVYGVRLEDSETPDPFLTPPTVEVGDSLDDIVPPESTEVVRDLVSGERDSVPGLEETDEPSYEDDDIIEAPSSPAEAVGSGIDELEAQIGEDDGGDGEAAPAEDAGTDDVAEAVSGSAAASAGADDAPMAGDAPTTGDAPTAADGTAEDDATTAEVSVEDEAGVDATDATPDEADQGGVPITDAGREDHDPVAALADAIRNGDAAEEDLAVVREELGVAEEPKSTDVKVEHLQARVSDLEAYADALEAFIDENGAAEDLLADVEEIEDGVERNRATVDEVDERVTTLESEHDVLRSDLEALETDVADLAALGEDLERLEGDLEALDERVADVEEVGLDLEELSADVEAVREDVEDLEDWRDQLSSVLG